MTAQWSSHQIRALVARIFEEFLPHACELADVDESVRIGDGRLLARTYRAYGLFAMWLTPMGLLQFYDHEGNMLRTVNLLAEIQPLRAAA